MENLKNNFNWNDYLVIEFAKISSRGSYGVYSDCKGLTQKLDRFKNLHTNGLSVSDLRANQSLIHQFLDIPDVNYFLPYHTSMDALSPVVKKCLSSLNNGLDYSEDNDFEILFKKALNSVNVDNIYKVVIRFINSLKLSNN